MVNVLAQTSNRNTVKQSAENGKNIPGDEDAGGWYYVTGARRQKIEVPEWSWIQPGINGLQE